MIGGESKEFLLLYYVLPDALLLPCRNLLSPFYRSTFSSVSSFWFRCVFADAVLLTTFCPSEAVANLCDSPQAADIFGYAIFFEYVAEAKNNFSPRFPRDFFFQATASAFQQFSASHSTR